MEIRLPKPTCPDCKSESTKVYSDNETVECSNCGNAFLINFIWQEESKFCQCELCKKLMA